MGQTGTRAEVVEPRARAGRPANDTKIPTITLLLALGSILMWVIAWAALWVAGESETAGRYIFEPAVVALTLGFIGLAWFAAIYFREAASDENLSHRLRSAIAGSVVIVFLLLVIDLLLIAALRESLESVRAVGEGAATDDAVTAEQAFNFVEEILDTFKWVVITVVGFYFGAGAVEAVGQNVEESATRKAAAEEAKAAAEVTAAETKAAAEVTAAEANREAATATLETTKLQQ